METTATRRRSGILTAWLIIMILANGGTALMYFFDTSDIQQNSEVLIPTWTILTLGFLAMLNVIYAVMLFQWNRIGFWGFALNSVLAVVLNIYAGMGVPKAVLGVLGIAILYGILQIKKDNVSGWEHLNSKDSSAY